MFASKNTIINTFVFIAWVIVAIIGIINHEFWRDEMRALSIAISAPGFSDFPAYLKNEGHPILWYFVLKLAYNIFHTTWVLPVLSFLFSAGICWLIVYRSPFPLLVKILVVFGFYCLYEYGINCRNYGIAAFFLLLFANLYTRKPDKVILAGVYLALAAQCNIYAAMLATLIFCWIGIEKIGQHKINRAFFIACFILMCSVIWALVMMLPNADTLVVGKKIIDFNLFNEIWLVGNGFDNYLKQWVSFNDYTFSFLMLCSILMFVYNIRIFITLVFALLVMAFFSLCIKGNMPHHEGMYFYVFLVFCWIDYGRIKDIATKFSLKGIPVWISILANVIIIYNIFIKGFDAYMLDLQTTKSESKAFGKWCKRNLSEKDILIAEPDFTLEGVMFYHYQPFYIPRESRVGTYVHFTSRNKSYLGLNELIIKADSLSKTYRDIYLVFGKRVANTDSTYSYSYGKKFKVIKGWVDDLSTKYNLVDSFNQNFHNEENYYVYKKRNN